MLGLELGEPGGLQSMVEDGIIRKFDADLKVVESALRLVVERDAITREVRELLSRDEQRRLNSGCASCCAEATIVGLPPNVRIRLMRPRPTGPRGWNGWQCI